VVEDAVWVANLTEAVNLLQNLREYGYAVASPQPVPPTFRSQGRRNTVNIPPRTWGGWCPKRSGRDI
jgi:hypothetical protein